MALEIFQAKVATEYVQEVLRALQEEGECTLPLSSETEMADLNRRLLAALTGFEPDYVTQSLDNPLMQGVSSRLIPGLRMMRGDDSGEVLLRFKPVIQPA